MKVREGTEADIDSVHGLIVALATFENEPHAVTNTPAAMLEDFRGGHFGFFVATSGQDASKVVGFSLYHRRYSTWTGRCLYLEDIFVSEEFRGKGTGDALFRAVARVAKQENCARLQWQVLDWNAKAIEFYKKRFGAEITHEWLNCKLTRDQLQKDF